MDEARPIHDRLGHAALRLGAAVPEHGPVVDGRDELHAIRQPRVELLDDAVGRRERLGLGRRASVLQEAVGAVDVEDRAVPTGLATVDDGLDLGRGGNVDGGETVRSVRLLHEHRERVRVEPGVRRDNQRGFVAGRPKFGGGGHRGRAHLVGLTGSGRDSPRQLVAQVAGDVLLRLPLATGQAARLDLDGRRSAERVGRAWSRDPSRVVEHHPGGLPVAARDGLIEHRCADGRAGRPAARGQPRSKRTGGASRTAFGNRRTELAPECTPAQPSRERPGAGHERSLEGDACTLGA